MAKFWWFEGAFSWFFIELETHCLIATAQGPNCSYNKGYIAYMRETAIFILPIWGHFQLILFHRKSKKSAIFLLPVYLAYWSRKRAMCWATHVDHFHQVWRWYDYPLLSYSVVPTWPRPLTLDSGQTWLVMWSPPPPSLKILRLSVLDYELWCPP